MIRPNQARVHSGLHFSWCFFTKMGEKRGLAGRVKRSKRRIYTLIGGFLSMMTPLSN